MIIAIPANEDKTLCSHFGHAPRFAIIKTDADKNIVSAELLEHEGGGHKALPPWLKSLGVELLIAGGLGAPAMENLNAHGIAVLAGAPPLDTEEVVRLFLSGKLENRYTPCNHHGEHHHHEEGHECGHHKHDDKHECGHHHHEGHCH